MSELAHRDDLTAEMLRAVLRYDAETGSFSRIAGPSSGRPVGNVNSWNGYVNIRVAGHTYKAHRLAWLHVHGRWPAQQIDHINCVKTDNRIANLREATMEQNVFNRGVQRSNKLGIKGVAATRGGRYQATIETRGKRSYLGTFDTPEQASRAYQEALKEQHGEFARY